MGILLCGDGSREPAREPALEFERDGLREGMRDPGRVFGRSVAVVLHFVIMLFLLNKFTLWAVDYSWSYVDLGATSLRTPTSFEKLRLLEDQLDIRRFSELLFHALGNLLF